MTDSGAGIENMNDPAALAIRLGTDSASNLHTNQAHRKGEDR